MVYKHYFYALTMIFAFLNGQVIKCSDLGEIQAKKYISHLLDNLFIPHNHSIANQQHLHNFGQELTNNLMRNLGVYPHFYSFSKMYSDQQLYQEVINESLAFIQRCTYNCAINEIQTYYTDITGNQEIFVNKIVGLIMKELKTKINKSAELPQGLFTGYFGKALADKVHNLVDKEIKKETARLEKVNSKIKCSTCASNFDMKMHKKIILSCNHNICMACLKQLWYKMGTKTACAKCNAKINISDHVHGAWVTPSPNSTSSDYYYTDYSQSANGDYVDYNQTYYIDPNQTYYY